MKDGRLMYDFAHCLEFLEIKGKQLFGERFTIFKEDQELIYRLLVYMIGDKEGARQKGVSLEKGILLTGPVGCGKTSLMRLVRLFQKPDRRYIVKSSRDISFEFIKDGYDVISHYANRSQAASHNQPMAYCFDDLGLESNLKYYGNQCNVMGEILLSRYDQFVSVGLITHGTTNLNSTEIEQLYGNRVRSRMREMFNLIAFHKDAKDKRI